MAWAAGSAISTTTNQLHLGAHVMLNTKQRRDRGPEPHSLVLHPKKGIGLMALFACMVFETPQRLSYLAQERFQIAEI